jgi:probable rRNA maturation factor
MTNNTPPDCQENKTDLQVVETKRSMELFNESGRRVPFSQEDLHEIVNAIEQSEACRFNELEVVFVTEQEILQINRHYLSHDYVTDVITFPYSSQKSRLEGTLYCCAEQIEQQSVDYGASFREETARVVIHGLLHLAGFTDESADTQAVMREKEQFYLQVTKKVP